MCAFFCRYFGKHDPTHSEYQMISNISKVRREGGKEGRSTHTSDNWIQPHEECIANTFSYSI